MVTRRTFLMTPLAVAAAAAADRKPNVVLIVAGDWRSQAVPWAKDAEIELSNLAAFGRQSVTFSRAYASYPRTAPARSALLKGRFPMALSTETPGIAALLKTAGYRVGIFGNRQSEDIVSFTHVPGSAPFYVEWIFDAPSVLMQRVNETRVQLRENVPEGDKQRARALLIDFYSRCIARDRDIGMVLAALDRPGLLEDTLVIFTSDHGNQFGSQGIFGDDSPYEESVRVPLAIRYPRVIRRQGDSTLLISQIDILPTVAAICGAAIPNEAQGRDLSLQILEGSGELPDAVYAAGHSSQREEWRMLVHGYDKLVTNADGNVTHLYNLAEDPFEKANLAEASSEQLKRDALLAQLQTWTRKLGDRVDPASGLRTR